jgi:D-hydroxyproline dehydrogenase subunit beta
MRTLEADVCVVGAGIVGLAHALEARARGLSVAVIERDERAVGASVRNFGHVIVSGMAAGEPLAVALDARERWLSLGRRAGLAVRESGSLIVARAADELAVLEAVAAEPERGAALLTAAQVAALAPIPTDELIGGLHCRLDLRVDPRAAAGGLAGLLHDDPGARMLWSAEVREVRPGAVSSSRGEVAAPLVIVCPGPGYDWLTGDLALQRPRLTRCKLQMLRVRAPGGRRYEPALLTGLSLVRYPGFGARPEGEPLAARLAAECPELIEAGIHVIVTQLPDGDLLIGDTHEYGATVSPFSDERLDQLVLAQARRLLGAGVLEVVQRWQGVYPSAPGDPFLIERPLPGVAVVEIVSGVGMTTALGVAARTFAALGDPVGAAA